MTCSVSDHLKSLKPRCSWSPVQNFDCRLTSRSQGRVYVLPDVWIRPPFGGRGRKMTGQLEAHANGFRYTSPKGETLDIMYRCGMRSMRASRMHRRRSCWRYSPRRRPNVFLPWQNIHAEGATDEAGTARPASSFRVRLS